MKKLLKSFIYAGEGIAYGLLTQRNMKIHVTVALLVIILGAIFSLHVVEWLIVLIVIGAVISLELVNTAIESTVDLVTDEHKALAKIAKDTAAGAVLIMAIVAAIIGCVIFIPKIFEL